MKAIEEIEIDRKRDRSKSDAEKQPESKRPRGNTKPPLNSGRNNPGPSTNIDGTKTASREGFKPQRESQNTAIGHCFYCKKPGHIAKECRKKKSNESEGITYTNHNRIAAATTTGSGKA